MDYSLTKTRPFLHGEVANVVGELLRSSRTITTPIEWRYIREGLIRAGVWDEGDIRLLALRVHCADCP